MCTLESPFILRQFLNLNFKYLACILVLIFSLRDPKYVFAYFIYQYPVSKPFSSLMPSLFFIIIAFQYTVLCNFVLSHVLFLM